MMLNSYVENYYSFDWTSDLSYWNREGSLHCVLRRGVLMIIPRDFIIIVTSITDHTDQWTDDEGNIINGSLITFLQILVTITWNLVL